MLFRFAGNREPERQPYHSWTAKVRDHLLETQVLSGPNAGSWHQTDGEAALQWGGRLYCTVMSTLVLEVPFDYPPMFHPPRWPQPSEESSL
jgi:hypothetical protein